MQSGVCLIELSLQSMSEEQLSALHAKLKDDAGLQAKLKVAADLDAAVALAKEAGFDVSKADLLRYQAKQTLELNDEDLEVMAGGRFLMYPGAGMVFTTIGCYFGAKAILDATGTNANTAPR
jgi:predicted ribosomally synthesized peptide with nif11-like leader